MASSGTIRNAIRTGYAIQIFWKVDSQSVANNTSSVTAMVQLVSTGSSYTINSSASKSGSLTINGTKYTFTFSASLSGNQTKTIFTKTVTVSHNADGSKTCSFACEAGINVTLSGTYYGTVTASGNGVFDTIARASTISAVTSSVAINGTNAVSVSITRALSSFTHTVVFSFGSYSQTQTGIGTSTSFVIPTSWINAMPNATSGTATVTVTTYSGSTKIGSSVTSTFTVTVPSTVVPTIVSVAISEGTAGIQPKFVAYVQNHSTLKIVTSASGIYSSTIRSVKTNVNGVVYSGNDITTGVLTTSGSLTIVITVADSRGREVTVTRTITVVPYQAPKITTFKGFRSRSNGDDDPDGTYLNAVVNFSISSVNNKNNNTYSISYRLKDSSTWTTMTSGTGYAVNRNIVSSTGFLSKDSPYEIRLVVTDFFGSVSSVFDISSTFTLIDFNGSSGKGIAFGKVSDMNAMEVDLPLHIYKDAFIYGMLKSYNEREYVIDTNHTASDDVGMVQLSNGLLLQWGYEYMKPVANTPTSVQVTFPVAYSYAPFVVTSPLSTVIGNSVRGSSASHVTAMNFNMWIHRTDTVETTVKWVAIGIKN